MTRPPHRSRIPHNANPQKLMWRRGLNQIIAAHFFSGSGAALSLCSPLIPLPAKSGGSHSKLFYTELSMSYQSAIDHLAAMAPELATQTGQTRRKFSIDEVAIL